MALLVAAAPSSAQTQPGRQPVFEVASVKHHKSDTPPNQTFISGRATFTPRTGVCGEELPALHVHSLRLECAGSRIESLVAQLPAWVMNDHFDIQARAPGNPTKDEMRLMMQSLLADRFHFAIQAEKKELPVVALVLGKPGTTGPELHPHPADAPCETNEAALQASPGRAFWVCLRACPGDRGSAVAM